MLSVICWASLKKQAYENSKHKEPMYVAGGCIFSLASNRTQVYFGCENVLIWCLRAALGFSVNNTNQNKQCSPPPSTLKGTCFHYYHLIHFHKKCFHLNVSLLTHTHSHTSKCFIYLTIWERKSLSFRDKLHHPQCTALLCMTNMHE